MSKLEWYRCDAADCKERATWTFNRPGNLDNVNRNSYGRFANGIDLCDEHGHAMINDPSSFKPKPE